MSSKLQKFSKVKTNINKNQKSQNNKDAFNINVYRGSSKLIKYVTQAVILTITYVVNIQNKYYHNKHCLGLKTATLLEVKGDAIPINISIKDALKTIGNKYLQKLVVYIYNDAKYSVDNLVSFSIFEYTYFTNSKSKKSLNISFKDFREKYQKFMQTCVAISNLIPCCCKGCTVDFSLYLNNETPESYQPDGYFVKYEDVHDLRSAMGEQFQEVARETLETNFHAITISVYLNKQLTEMAV